MENFPKWILTAAICLFLAFVIIIGLFTNYKQETLVCSKSDDICFVEKTNMFNMKSRNKLVKYSDISDVSYIKQKIKGNRYANGYIEYLLIFNLKNNDRKIIFSESFFDKEEIFGCIKDLRTQINNNKNEIILNRN